MQTRKKLELGLPIPTKWCIINVKVVKSGVKCHEVVIFMHYVAGSQSHDGKLVKHDVYGNV